MLVCKLEEFPSLKAPYINNNRFRRKKRRLILYSLYVFSVLVIYRLLMTSYWLYSLDIDSLSLNKIVYDTRMWTKIDVDVLLANSRSPIDVNFTNIQISLVSVDQDEERLLLTLIVPAVSLKKGKNVVFNGSIYIDKIDKKNLGMAILCTKFALKVDSRLYPRICFIRFPFKRSLSFSLDSPASKSRRRIELEKVHFETSENRLLVYLFVNNTRLMVPKFIAIRSQGICILLGTKTSLVRVSIGYIDLHDSFFENPLRIEFHVTRSAYKWVKNNIIAALKGRETGFRVDSIKFFSPFVLGIDPLDVGLTFGINAGEDTDYDVVLTRKAKPQKPWKPAPTSSVTILFDEDQCINLKMAKKKIPLVSNDTEISMSNTGTTFIMLLNRKHLISFNSSIDDAEGCVVLKLNPENMHMLNLVNGLISTVKAPGIDIVMNCSNILGLVLNDIKVSFGFNGRMRLRLGRYKLIDRKPTGENNAFDIEHCIYNLNEEMVVDTILKFNSISDCYTNEYVRLVHSGAVYCMKDLDIGVKISIEAFEAWYVACGPLSRCLYGRVLIRTQISDSFEKILEHFEKHSKQSNEGKNNELRSIMELLENRRSSKESGMKMDSKYRTIAEPDEGNTDIEYEQRAANNTIEAKIEGGLDDSTDDEQYDDVSYEEERGGFIGNVNVRHDNTKPKESGKYFFDVDINDGRIDVEKGLCFRNEIQIANTSIGICSKSSLMKMNGMSQQELMDIAPVKLNFNSIQICCVWRGSLGVWLERSKPIEIGVTILNLKEAMQLMNGELVIVMNEDDKTLRNIKTLMNAYMSINKEKEKYKMKSKEGIDASISIKKRNEKDSVDTYEIDCIMCVPKKVIGYIGLIDVPSIEVKLVKNIIEYDDVNGHILSIKVYTKPDSGDEYKRNVEYGIQLCVSAVEEHHDPIRMILMINGNECEDAIFMPEEYKKMMEDMTMLFGKKEVGNRNRKKTIVKIESINEFGVEGLVNGFCIDRNKWFIRINDERMKEFVFCRLPNIFLNSPAFSMVPSGVRMVFRVDKDVINACVKSKKKNPWKETGRGTKVEFDRGLKNGHKIFEFCFSDIECSEAIRYDFSSLNVLRLDGRKMLKCEDYHNPFVGTNEYKNWNASLMIAGSFNAWNEGILNVHDVWCEMPFVSFISRLMPKRNNTNKTEKNYAGMYTKFGLPFEIYIDSNLIFEINIVSKRNDKVLLSTALRKSRHETNSLFVVTTIPPGSYILDMNHLRHLLDTLFGSGRNNTIIQDVTINVFVNKRKCSRFNNRIEIDGKEIKKKDVMKAIVFILDKRAVGISDMALNRYLKKLD
ncbi:hypothetical protein OCOL_000557 [Ordospora colligata]